MVSRLISDSIHFVNDAKVMISNIKNNASTTAETLLSNDVSTTAETPLSTEISVPAFSESEWKSIAPMSKERAYAGFAVIDDYRFVMIGGIGHLSSGEMYDRRTNEWTDLPNDMPDSGRWGCGAITVDNKVYIVGGSSSNSLFALDITTYKWETLPFMKHQRSVLAVVADKRYIYVFGGRDKEQVALNSAERYNIDTKIWEDLPSMSTKRGGSAAVMVQNKIYVIGGYDGTNRLASVEVFDVETQQWESPSSVSDMSVARRNCAAVVVDGHYVAAIGGFDQSNGLSSIEILDTSSGIWTESLQKMITPRAGHGAVAFGETDMFVSGGRAEISDFDIYVAGGGDGSRSYNTCDSIPSSFLIPQTSNVSEDEFGQSIFNGSNSKEKFFGTAKDIFALTQMLLLTRLITPFVLALLGGLGSSKKSTFNWILRYLMEFQKMNLTNGNFEEDHNFPYCGHIYYVKFDSWIFAQGNLWASLMHQILVSLNDQLHLESLLRKENPGILLKGLSTIQLVEELASGEFTYLQELVKKGKIKDKGGKIKGMSPQNGIVTEALIEATSHAYDTSRADLEAAQMDKAVAEQELAQKLSEKQIITKSIDQKITLRKIWESVFDKSLSGIPTNVVNMLKEAFDTYEQKHPDEPVPQTFQECISTLNIIKKLYWNLRVGKVPIMPGVLFLVAFILAISVPISTGRYQALWASIAPLSPIAIGLFIKSMSDAQDRIEKAEYLFTEAKNRAKDVQVHYDIEDMNVDEIEDVKHVNQRIQELAVSITKFDKIINRLQEKAWLVEGESIDDLVKERMKPGNYKENFGIVHKAKHDLQLLSDAMLSNVRNDVHKPLEKKIFPRGDPRIVLCIDDLDRCSPEKVLETLEALQLFVNTKLFVVVVAIGTRYATLSFQKKYYGTLFSADNHHHDASGLHYLDKYINLGYQVPSIPTDASMKAHMRSQFHEVIQNNDKVERETQQLIINEDNRNMNPQVEQHDNANEGSEEEIQEDHTTRPDEINTDLTENHDHQREEQKNKETTLSEYLTRIPKAVLGVLETEMEMLEEAAIAANVNPLAGQRIANAYKTMKLNWYLGKKLTAGETEPDNNVKKVLILVLAMSASSTKSIREGVLQLFEKIEQKTSIGRLHHHHDEEKEKESLLTLFFNHRGNTTTTTTTTTTSTTIEEKCNDLIEITFSPITWTTTEEWEELKKDLLSIRPFSFLEE